MRVASVPTQELQSSWMLRRRHGQWSCKLITACQIY